jgi:hypothetical protein
MILSIFILMSLFDTLLLLKLLCLLSSTSTCVLTSLFTFFAAAIKAFKWAVTALNIIVNASAVDCAVIISALADVV